MEIKAIIEKAWDDRSLLQNNETQAAIKAVIEDLDKGVIRVAQPEGDKWVVNEWIKKAVILYFPQLFQVYKNVALFQV